MADARDHAIVRATWLALAAWFAVALYAASHASCIAATIAVSVCGLSWRRPADGLLVIAGLLPLATPIGLLIQPPMTGRQAGELLILSFLAPGLLRYGSQRVPLSSPLGPIIATCAAAIAMADVVSRRHGHRPIDLADGAGILWLEAIALAYIADATVRDTLDTRARVCRLLLIGAAAASVFTVNRMLEVYLRNAYSIHATLQMLSTARIGIHAADINAMGSMYTLFAVPACWLAFTHRAWWRWGVLLLVDIALWRTGARMAMAAGLAGLLIIAVRTHAIRRRTVLAGIVVAALIAVPIVGSAPRPLSSLDALEIRVEMATIGLRLFAAHPFCGVGPGQFAAASRRFVSDDLATLFPNAVNGENAHNNFVQVFAEFGLPGGCALVALVVFSLTRAWQAMGHDANPEAAGLGGGLVAFLLTCLSGHPLLTPHCLWLFFLVVGVTTAISSPTLGEAAHA